MFIGRQATGGDGRRHTEAGGDEARRAGISRKSPKGEICGEPPPRLRSHSVKIFGEPISRKRVFLCRRCPEFTATTPTLAGGNADAGGERRGDEPRMTRRRTPTTRGRTPTARRRAGIPDFGGEPRFGGAPPRLRFDSVTIFVNPSANEVCSLITLGWHRTPTWCKE